MFIRLTDFDLLHNYIIHKVTFKNNRSEEHTSELQSQSNLVCRLLLEKKKKLEVSHSPQYTSTTKMSILSSTILRIRSSELETLPIQSSTRYPARVCALRDRSRIISGL